MSTWRTGASCQRSVPRFADSGSTATRQPNYSIQCSERSAAYLFLAQAQSDCFNSGAWVEAEAVLTCPRPSMHALPAPSSSLPENDGDVLRLESAGAEMNVLAQILGDTALPGTATMPDLGGKTSSKPLPGAATNRTLAAPAAGPAANAAEAATGLLIIAPAEDYPKEATNTYCSSFSPGLLPFSC